MGGGRIGQQDAPGPVQQQYPVGHGIQNRLHLHGLGRHGFAQAFALDGVGGDVGDGGEQAQVVLRQQAPAADPKQAGNPPLGDQRRAGRRAAFGERLLEKKARVIAGVVVEVGLATGQHVAAEPGAGRHAPAGEKRPSAAA